MMLAAINLVEEADQLAADGFLRNLFRTKEERKQDAADKYKQAAIKFRMEKQHDAAVECYVKMRDCGYVVNDMTIVTDALGELYKMKGKQTTQDLNPFFNELALLRAELGQHSQAGRIYMDYGTIDGYLNAIEMFDISTGNDSNKYACQLSLSKLYWEQRSYREACDLLEQVITATSDTPMLKLRNIKLMFKLGLLYVIIDTNTAKNKFDLIDSMDATFSGREEGKWLYRMLDTVVNEDLDQFNQLVHEPYLNLDTDEINLLLLIRKPLEEDENSEDLL